MKVNAPQCGLDPPGDSLARLRHTPLMPERSRKAKRPRDTNQLAKLVVERSTGEYRESMPGYEGKNPAAVALGRLGGKKGGVARAAKLTPSQRRAIAEAAAAARWKKSRED